MWLWLLDGWREESGMSTVNWIVKGVEDNGKASTVGVDDGEICGNAVGLDLALSDDDECLTCCSVVEAGDCEKEAAGAARLALACLPNLVSQ
jgi:hypothetical protein